MNGIPKVVPIEYNDFKKSLGPGYEKGWYTPSYFGGRKSNCRINIKNKKMKKFKKTQRQIMIAIRKKKRVDRDKDLGKKFENGYHGAGHNLIAKNCYTSEKKTT